MSTTDTEHVHDENCGPAVIICGPGKLQYYVYKHRRGAQKSELVAKRLTVAAAFREVANVISGDHMRDINRVYVLSGERGLTYYEPELAYEVRIQ